MPSLRIEKQGAGAPSTVALDKTIFSIGKSADNDLVLDAAGISRYHCELLLQAGGRAVVRDMGSRNGTFVENERLRSDRVLKGGEKIQLGEYSLTFLEDEPGKKGQAKPGQAGARPPSRSAQKPPREEFVIPPELRKTLHHELLQNIGLKRLDISKLSQAEVKQKTRETIEAVVARRKDDLPANLPQEKLVQDLLDHALGLGPLEDLLKDQDITEIMVNRFDRIYVERSGRIELTQQQFIDNHHVVEIIRRIIAPIGRRIDESSPMVDARLPDGSRVNAIIPPLAVSGPSITVRKFSVDPFKVSDLIRFNSLTEKMARFLELCVRHRENICISGGTGSGKTTLLNVLSMFIPETERIITIEDAAELRLPQEHVVSLESKPPNIEGEGAIPIRKLVINALRMRPDRIIVGECRGGEALDMLQAMNTGHDGSLTTLHANSCRDAISRLCTMALMAGMELPTKAILEQISSAIDVIIQTARLPDGTRRVTRIVCVTGMEGEVITLQDVFVFQQEGFDSEGRVLGSYVPSGTIPSFVHEWKNRGLEVDLEIFRP